MIEYCVVSLGIIDVYVGWVGMVVVKLESVVKGFVEIENYKKDFNGVIGRLVVVVGMFMCYILLLKSLFLIVIFFY